jgi:hypothetical protein
MIVGRGDNFNVTKKMGVRKGDNFWVWKKRITWTFKVLEIEILGKINELESAFYMICAFQLKWFVNSVEEMVSFE